jgi:predicted permease
MPILEDVVNDCRYALGSLRRSPGFTTTVVLTVAVGIGATTAIFSVVRGVLLRPLPYHEPGRLVMLWTDDPRHGIHEEGVSYPNFVDWRGSNQSFEDMAILSRNVTVTLTGGAEPEQVRPAVVSPGFFEVLGVEPALGRPFSVAEAEAREKVVVLSHSFWLKSFGGSANAIGSMLEIDGSRWRVSGVMPASFQFPDRDTALWLPLPAFRAWPGVESERFSDWGRVVARVKPGVSIPEAQAEMIEIGRRLEYAHPAPAAEADFAGFGVNVVPLTDQLLGRQLPLTLWVLFAGVSGVLFIACANVASLLLARGASREREIAVRRALGASRGRVFRQLLTESVLLAAIAGCLGLAIAAASVDTLVTIGPRTLPRLHEIAIDLQVLAFAVAASLTSVVLFGLVPALQLSQGTVTLGSRGATPGVRSARMRRLLVIGECALSVVLLSASGLLIRSFLVVEAAEPGFQAEGALRMRLVAPGTRRAALDFYARALEQLQSLPGVTAAGVVEDVLQRRNPDFGIVVEHRAAAATAPLAGDAASPGFFRAIGARLVEGRAFSDDDRAGAPPVAVVNETMARRFWPGASAIGKRFRASDAAAGDPWTSVVGVVADMRREGLERQPIAQVFWPLAQRPVETMDLVVRTSGNPANLARSVREQIHTLDRRVAVGRSATLEELLDDSVSPRRFHTALLTLLASVGLLLAAIGVYGLMHYAVVQRTHELGIRVALGAQSSDLLRMVLREGMSAVAIGMATGMLLSLWVSRALTSLLVGVGTGDPVTLALVTALLGTVAAGACSIPARAAVQTDPVAALRDE